METHLLRLLRHRLASFKEHLAAAQSGKVQTAILGIELDSTLESAHAKLDSLGQPSDRPLDGADETGERNEREHKISWQLAKTDYASVFVKADEKNRVTYIAGYLRPGKEMPFDKMGQVEKAPVLSDRVVGCREAESSTYSCCSARLRAESRLHHDVHRETPTHRLARVDLRR